MAYEKAADLLDLALEMAAHRYGMPFGAIDDRSTAPTPVGKRRNTQRMVRALERVFGDRLRTGQDELGQKRAFLQGAALRDVVAVEPGEMAALDRAIDALLAANDAMDAENLKGLRTKIRLASASPGRAGFEVDYEALLRTGHVAARPGPRPLVEPAVIRPLSEAVLSLKCVSFDYGGEDRRVHPYGVIFGHRIYLVALVEDGSGEPAIWRVDRMRDIEVLDTAAEIPDDFDISRFARRSFGAFHNVREFGPVEWRFSAGVADSVRSFCFHPDQALIENTDGTVTVKFHASGHLEMAWALYAWGDNVEVIEPEAVRRMVEGHRRGDFPGVP